MSTTIGTTPQGGAVALGIPDSQDYPRLVYVAPYFREVPLAELIEPSVQEAVEGMLPSLVPPYVNNAAEAAVQQLAVLLTGSTMSGPLMLAPLMPTADSMAATKAYVDTMVATAGVPEVPAVPIGQTWARQTGQWIPLDPSGGAFLPLAGGVMQGQINMSGYAINNLAALPNMPNGAAPANWVLQQIASVSLYQGTWNMDTYTPDLTNPNTHVNGYTWIAITTSTSGVVIGPAIPGLQGQTVFNGDTIIWSNIQGQFNRIHSGGLSLAEAQALFLPYSGGTMTGPLLAFENPTEAMEVATMGWVQSLLPPGGVIPEAPTDGQLYGRNGLTKVWLPVLPLAGGVMTGPILLSGNATNALNPVPLQQLTGTLASTYMPLAGGTMTGLLVLSGNASANLNPVPLQQLNAMLGSYMPLGGGTFTGPITAPAGSTIAGYVPLAGNVTIGGNVGFAVTLPADISGTGGQILSQLCSTNNLAINTYIDNTGQQRRSSGSNAPYQFGSGGAIAYLSAAPVGAVDSVASLAPILAFDQGGVRYYTAALGASNGNAFAFGWNTTSNSSTPGVQLGVNSTAQGYVIASLGVASTYYGVLQIRLAASQTTMLAWGEGNTSVTWSSTPSDRRLKENAAPATDALAAVNAVPVYEADYVAPVDDYREHWDFTFMADEVQAVLPFAYMPPPVDAEGNEAGHASLHPLHLIATLWKAVQELSAQVKSLQPA